MDAAQVIEVAFKALTMAFVISGPVLIALLIAGLIIGVLQAATSINESSVAFVPKLIVIALVLLIAGPSTLSIFVDYLRGVIADFPAMLR